MAYLLSLPVGAVLLGMFRACRKPARPPLDDVTAARAGERMKPLLRYAGQAG
jgi:hypothetical protein